MKLRMKKTLTHEEFAQASELVMQMLPMAVKLFDLMLDDDNLRTSGSMGSPAEVVTNLEVVRMSLQDYYFEFDWSNVDGRPEDVDADHPYNPFDSDLLDPEVFEGVWDIFTAHVEHQRGASAEAEDVSN